MSSEKNDPRYSLMSQLFERVPSRSEKRILSILEGAIRSYGTQGIEGSTFDSIAKAAKTSRALVLYYFKDKSAIFDMTMRYIRLNYQRYVVDKMSKKTDPKSQMEAYLTASVTWSADYPDHSNVWILYWYQCATDKKARALNSEMQDIGRARIQGLIEAGVLQKVFACKDVYQTALRIQSLIIGTLVMQRTQNLSLSNKDWLHAMVSDVFSLLHPK